MKNIIIGMLFCGLLYSCGTKRISYAGKATWEFQNESSYVVKVDSALWWTSPFTLEKGGTYSFDEIVDTAEEVTADSFMSPYSDNPVSIILDDKRFVENEAIMDVKNFKSEKINDRHYKFTYTFTDADFPAE